MNELIITVGAVCAAILSIAGVIKLLYSVIKQMNKMSNESKEQSKTLKDVELNVLRLTIMSNEMPLSERITAGDIYTKKAVMVLFMPNMKNYLKNIRRKHKNSVQMKGNDDYD